MRDGGLQTPHGVPRRHARTAVLALAAALIGPAGLAAQTDVEALGRLYGGARPPAGYYEMLRRQPHAFQFAPNHGWARRARDVSQVRGLMRAAGDASGAPVAGPQRANVNGDGVLRGNLTLPVFLAMYANTDSAITVTTLPRDSMEYRLFGTHAAPPYSIHSYYRELSSDSLQVNGLVLDWARVSKADTAYEGGCNGLCSQGDVAGLIREVVQLHDGVLDYGLFDNDGPDGMPNSGDDDGFVDAIVLLHPEVGAECRQVNPASQDNIWSHRFSYAGWTGAPLATQDAAAGGGVIQVNNYVTTGGQGGDAVPAGRGGCGSGKPQAMGVVAHEIGHLFNLPDLYDTIGSTSGIGWWGLMGSGNQKVAWRPAHLEAWSRAELGWIAEVRIDRDTVLDISAVALADTAYVLPVCNSNEYFLVENRQAIGSDSMLAGFGLLIWHVDSALIQQRRFANQVNGALPHGLALEQADGAGDLEASRGRGDAGDPFPGSTGNTRFSFATSPANTRHDGMPIELTLDGIQQLLPGGPIRVNVSFTAPAIVVGSGQPPAGRAGLAYTHTFTATGGVGVYRWSVASGVLPSGLTLDAAGRLAGRPEQAGRFAFEVRATSGCSAVTQAYTIDVTAPTLALDTVVRHLVGAEPLLSPEDVLYLDVVGNKNGRFDVGDFLAWIETTGGTMSPSALRAAAAGDGSVPASRRGRP